jgi:hypothetical protein
MSRRKCREYGLTASFTSVTPGMKRLKPRVGANLLVAAGIQGNAMDWLASAVVDAESHAASKGWDQAPQLYALARKNTLRSADAKAAADLRGRPEDALIPIEQDQLPSGEPDEVLAGIHWPEEVEGCVLVTELFVLPPDAEKDIPGEPTAVEEWAAGRPDGKKARLAVGVLRDGSYTCCLQTQDKEEALIVAPELAVDLVAVLLATFVSASTADADIPPGATEVE